MKWVLILVVFDHFSNGDVWMDNEVIPMRSEKKCIEQMNILKRELQTANTMMCVRK